MNMCATLKLTP